MAAPTLTNQTGSVTGPTSLDGSVDTDQGNGTLYFVTTTSATSPSATQVKNGQDNAGATASDSGSQSVSATGTQSIKSSGLIPNTSYWIHFMHENTGAEQSSVVTTSELTTDQIGTTGETSIYIKDSNGVWNEFIAYEFFKVEKRQNQISQFEVKVYDIQSSEKAYVKEFSEIMFFSDNTLILKGRIQKVTYETSFNATIKGYGMEAQLLDKELVENDNTSATWTDAKRAQWSNVSVQTIANELLSENTDGISPWIMEPRTSTGLFNTDWGTIHIRFEYANRLKGLAKLSEFIDYEWRVFQDTDFSDSFEIASLLPTTSRATNSQATFAITGSAANVTVTQKETDVSNLANRIDFLGFGDGTEQIRTSVYNASSVTSTLASDITSSDTTISLNDASSFPTSGTIRIMEEQVTYTGKSGNDLTGATRGANSTTARAHKKGIFVEKHVTIANAEAGSSIGDNGLMDVTVVNKEVIDRQTAELTATHEILNRLDPITRIRLSPMEPQETVRDLDIGDLVTVTDSEADISDDFRIVSIKYTSDFGLLNVELEVSNKTLTFIEQMKKNQEETDSLQRYMQGSTNIYSIQSYENADASNNMNIRFFLPDDVIALNSVKVSFKMKDFRAYSTGAASGGGTTQTSTSENAHSHNITINAESGAASGAAVFFSGSNLYSTFGGGTTATTIAQSAHSHDVTVPDHTHDISYGIFEETLSSPSVDLYTGEDGGTMTLKDTYTTDQVEVDITDEVASIGAGNWINVQFRPNKRMRIEANVYVRCFISTQWDFVTSTLLDDSVSTGRNPKAEEFRGSDLTGTDGATDRTLTLSETPNDGVVTVTVNGATLHEGASADFEISSDVITFKNKIWDSMYIRVNYLY